MLYLIAPGNASVLTLFIQPKTKCKIRLGENAGRHLSIKPHGPTHTKGNCITEECQANEMKKVSKLGRQCNRGSKPHRQAVTFGAPQTRCHRALLSRDDSNSRTLASSGNRTPSAGTSDKSRRQEKRRRGKRGAEVRAAI